MASPGDWNQVGYDGNPVVGNPDVIDGVTREFRQLRDLAGDVGVGLDNMLGTASGGGFEGQTADALRTYVKQELKTFMANVNRSFDRAASATARYAGALREAQGRAESAAERGGAVAIPPAGLVGKDAPPPAELTAAKNDVEAEVDFITGEAKLLEDALREAASMVSRPIKPPKKKSFWQKFVDGFWKALEILSIVLTVAAIIVGGPLGLLAFGVGAILFVKAVVDYAQGKTNALGLGLALLGILFPSTKGLTTVGGLMRLMKAGFTLGMKGGSRALGAGGRMLLQGGRLLMAPRTLATLTGQGLMKLSQSGSRMFFSGMSRLPGFLAGAPRAFANAMRFASGFSRGAVRWGRFAVRRDFFMTTGFVGGGMGRRLGVYALTNVGRAFDFMLSAFLPLRYSELARFGFRGAWRTGIMQRGLGGKPPIGAILGRGAASVAGDLSGRTARGLFTPEATRPLGEPGKLVVPGTRAWDDAVEELTEFTPPPAMLPRSTSSSSLPRVPGTSPNRFSGTFDDLVEPVAMSDLDALGSRLGPLLRNGIVEVRDLGADGLLPPQFRTALNTLDDLDELGGKTLTGPRSVLLEQPQSAVTRLRDLDAFVGLDRTQAGLLKPLDELAELAELAPFSVDGKLGGLTTGQLRKILDGEIDLVDVVPDGVILRIGKTDPVNIHVGLKDEVTIRVLDPEELGTGPLVGKFTGPDSPTRLGFRLDDLARLLPDAPGDMGRARELLGMGPLKNDLVSKTVTAPTGFPPLTLREIITGGAVGKAGADRFQAWVRAQNAAFDLDTAGQRLTQVADLPDVPPLRRAETQLDLSAAELKFNQARIEFDRLGMNLNSVRQNITVMMTRLDGPGAHLPVGELKLLDDLGQPTGRWITMEPGPTVNWVVRSDTGIVPDVKVQLTEGHFTVTGPDGIVTRFGPDGRPTDLGDLTPVSLRQDLTAPPVHLDDVTLPSLNGLDRLAAAADRSVDISAITPAPVWRTTDETLWRIGGKRSVDQIFSDGLRPRDPLDTNLDSMVRTGQPSAFVSTTTDQNLIWDGTFKYEIEAPGGIDVGRTFQRAEGTEAWKASGWEAEREIAFPGGIAPEFIRGAYQLDAQHNIVEWIPNPNFAGRNPMPDLAGDLRLHAEGPSGIGADDFRGLSLDDQLRLLDQLDLGGTSALDDLGGIGAHSPGRLSDLGDELDLGYLSESSQLSRFDAPPPLSELRLTDPGQTGIRVEWHSTPRAGDGVTLTDALGDVRLHYTADRALELVDLRIPGRDAFLRFDATPEMGALPRVVGPDGVPMAGTGVVVDPVKGAFGVVTGVKVGTPDGAWTARFDLDGTRLSEELVLSGHVGGALTDARLVTTFTRGPGGDMVPAFRVAAPGLGDGAFSVVRLPGDAAGRLPSGGFAVTDLADGNRFVFDRAGQFVDLPAEAPPIRLDTAGTTVPGTNTVPPTALDDFGGPLSERFPLHSIPENTPEISGLHIPENSALDGVAADLPRIEWTAGGDAPSVARLTDTASPTDLSLTRLTPFHDVRLSGVGDLAGLEFRITDGAPDAIRLDITQATPTPHGAGSQPRFTVERLDSGAFRVTDPAGTTRWEFSNAGEFLARETALVDNGLGLPSGLWFRSTPATMTDGMATRVVGLVGPRGVTDSFPLTTIDRTLQDRLPGGFTLTDSVTGSRFHYDADLDLAFRDVPARDGSGILRFTEGAPDVPPVRLDDLGGASGLDDLARIFERTLDEASGGTRPVSDLSLGTDLRLPGLDESTALRLPGPDALPALDDRALWQAVDQHWQGVLERTPGIRLSGAEDLADLEIRMVRVPSTDTAPGSFRLGLLDRAPAADGTVRGADFTVEALEGGRFAVTDPARNTTWTFAHDGSLVGREFVLAGEGLPPGLRISVHLNAADGTMEVIENGPAGSIRSMQLTATEGPLAGRLPGGFTLTDTVTGSRFHFDRSGALVFRDLPARDGSGFLRFTEGARDLEPTRLVDPLAERFPLNAIPEEDLLDDALTDITQLFERTLDEASGVRGVPDGAAADLSGISGAMEFLHLAPGSHALQNLDVLRVQQLAGDATDSLNRFGLGSDLLHDQFRQLTAQAHEGIRQGAATAMRQYLDLPLATRLEDLQNGGSRAFGDFTVTPTPHGTGPGGSRFTVTHTPTDLSSGFGANRELLYQEVFLRGGPAELDGTKLGLTGRAAEGGWTPDSVEFVGTRVADDAFTVTPLAPNTPTELRGGFTLTDTAGTTKWHYGPEGTLALRDVQLSGDRGLLRFDAGAPDGVPRVLDTSGNPSLTLRVERLDDGRIALTSTGKGVQPLERTVLDAQGVKVLEETVAVRVKGGKPGGQYWQIDHVTGKAVRVDPTGTPLTGRYATAKVEKSATGQFKLTGDGNVTLFEREVLRNGNVLQVDVDRVGRARWTEFDEAGTKVRSGERIWDNDRRTIHDTLSNRWAPVDVLDVRTYTKALDGGLIRAEKNASGDWSWTRFNTDGTEVLSGTRDWSWNRIGFKDSFLDPATGQRTLAQQRGNIWPLDGYHGSRLYTEHPVVPGHAPAGTRVDPALHTAIGPNNKPIDIIEELSEQLADGGTIHVVRISDQRLPAAFWYSGAGQNRFQDFFRNFATGDSQFQVSKWTEIAPDGSSLRGVRLVSHGGHSWQDIDQFGRLVRETRKLENGNVIEVGRSLTDPKQWAPAPKRNGNPASYELPWRDTTSGVFGTRHIAVDGHFEDVFRNAAGDEVLSMRSQGTGVREYLADNPARGIGTDDVSGVWVDKNTQMQITGRRDHWGDLHVEAHGNPRHRTWTWKATDAEGNVTEGVRRQSRGSLYSPVWDDSFTDFKRLDNGKLEALRERTATDNGTVWIDATRRDDDTWIWRKTDADGTVHSQGIRDHQDLAKGRWTDRIGDEVVRRRNGGRVREFAYTVEIPPTPVTPTLSTGGSTLSELLSASRRHFEPPVSVTVDGEVWREWDMGTVRHRRDPVEGVPGRYRESESLWGQWREYQDGRLVAQRTIAGRVWATDAFGRWSTFDVAKLPEISSLPSVGGQVGLDGHRSWRLIGREVDFRGYTTELRGVNREFRDVFHEIWTGVEDGSSRAMPMWRHQVRKVLTDFTMGYLIEFGTSFAVSAIVADINNTRFDPTQAFERALLNAAIGGAIRTGVNVLYDTTRLGYLKNGLTNLDQGMDFNRHPQASKDDWPGEWSAYENPTRWRSGSYDFFNNLGVGVLTGFVNGTVNAAVFGVNGEKRTGLDALEAGAWNAAASALTGVTSGLTRYAWHATAGSRVFHRLGPGDYLWQTTEALTAGIINSFLTGQNGANVQPSRAFPSTSTTPAPAPQPPADQPAALTEGMELP
ncbi:hypothetical protein SAMN04487981_105356 [Streptomyces sp. cf386]|uniref:scabin-related ADP-ribosyltransferase n=1 Tax=Streptomyces sp. cf386 TaxID=1761904 RepID=UPI00088FA867|nr:hypothetical protein [Streptomyces sp. cf386]SDN53274.1 hypothetical protein SAMN04487981_105356 [Streptomyces sp. cf386]